jgi:2-octaprenyl-6-methoxyphenol hydroxylase
LSGEVLIAGAGPLGLALGLALRHNGLACTLADARAAGAAAGDRRVLALSHGSRQILERLGVWPRLAATAITTIHVSQEGGLGRTLLRSRDYGLPALGYVLDAGSLAAALEAQASAQGLAIRRGCKVVGAEAGADHVSARLSGAATVETMRAALLAWAEGAVSGEAGSVVSRDYGHSAVVARVAVHPSSEGIAYERFTPAGPVALLPQGGDYCAIIARPHRQAEELLALPEAAFLERLARLLRGRLEFAALGPRTAFPLVLRYRPRPVGRRNVWLGNAAQTLHPVAGQGFNLALRDAWELARLLRDAPDPGDEALLQRHGRNRHLDRHGAIGFTDALVRIFGNHCSVLHHARGAGLLLLDVLPPGRDFLARRMMFGARAWL